MSKIKNGGLNEYGYGPFELQQFGTAGVVGVMKCGVATLADTSNDALTNRSQSPRQDRIYLFNQ